MKVVGVKFRDQGRIYDYDSTGFTLRERDIVVVDSERGPESVDLLIRLMGAHDLVHRRQLDRVLAAASPAT